MPALFVQEYAAVGLDFVVHSTKNDDVSFNTMDVEDVLNAIASISKKIQKLDYKTNTDKPETSFSKLLVTF